MAQVDLRHLSRWFGPVAAVRDLNLEVPSGDLLCLLGPSGSGKTTTMRMIAGLEAPDTGEVRLGDRDITNLEPRKRHIGMMFQGYALYPQMSVQKNIAYPLKVQGAPKDEQNARVAEVAAMLGIDHLLDRSITQVSGGQQQRIALARAIIQRPELYLLDEPISNLDAVLRAQMRGEIKRLQKMLGVTTIVVTHDQLDALAMADRIAVMNDGIIQQVGTPDDVYDCPANIFVARFIGEPQMNLVAGKLERRGDLVGVSMGKDWLHVTAAAARAMERASTDDVTVGIRPRAVRIACEAAEGRIPAEVYIVTPEGSRTIYEFRIQDQVIMVEAEPHLGIRMGDKAFLEFPADALHFFSTAEGSRIV
jgi:multiple sugar transport system ATP-binding protein